MPKWHRVQRPWQNWDELRLRTNLGVYLHVPFCLARCRYCDFLTYGPARPAGLEPAAYVETLLTEIARRGSWARQQYGSRGRVVDTVFIGGGTPTCLPVEQLIRLCRAITDAFACTERIEFTVEANPDTLTPTVIDALAAAGVNRLSIGIQATQPRHLRFLGRTHRWADIRPVLEYLRTGPIATYSFDLIYGLPRLRVSELKQSLARLAGLRSGHISAYELTREDGTPYARWCARFAGQPAREPAVVRQQQAVARWLAEHGYYRYEVSNYARPGAECRHNLRYWRGGDYLGLGLGAASRLGVRVVNNPADFGAYRVAVERIGTADDALGPRLDYTGPAPPADRFLQLRTRLGIAAQAAAIDPAWLSKGWGRLRDGRYEPTARGLSFADLLAREL